MISNNGGHLVILHTCIGSWYSYVVYILKIVAIRRIAYVNVKCVHQKKKKKMFFFD